MTRSEINSLQTGFEFPNLYCLTSDRLQSSHSDQVLTFCEHGVKFIQFRTKEMSQYDFLKQALRAVSICNAFDAKLIINDDVDIAAESDSHGVHLGRGDMNPKQARSLLGHDKIIGTTVHSKDEINQDLLAESDYIGMGPFRESLTKSALSPVLSTLDFSEMIKAVHPIPVYLIGGLLLADMKQRESLGNTGIAVCSALSSTKSLNTASITNFVKEANLANISPVLS